MMSKEEFEGKISEIDFSKRDQIVTLFPPYIQERYAIAKANKKNISNAINIEGFSMKTPLGDRVLISGSILKLEAQKRQCLFGANSTGKTLLFHNIAEGKIRGIPPHLHIHHCKELEEKDLNDTVFNTVMNSHPYRNALVRCRDEINKRAVDATGEEKAGLRDNLEYVLQQLTSIHGNKEEERANEMLYKLGFDEAGKKRPVSDLSGGLKMRVALAMAFFVNADLLLLDEPTNHLDFPSVMWLENRLRGYPSSFLLVSHDRVLLESVCTGVLLIEDRQIKYYPCLFSTFEKRKAEEDKKKYEEVEKFLEKNKNTDPSTPIGRIRHDKKEWSNQYYEKLIAMAGKFTFPSPAPLQSVTIKTDKKDEKTTDKKDEKIVEKKDEKIVEKKR